ncbi:hypothetical protein FRB99_006607 [Tulasnella sp. 403]|nr:hypothetical protein FRB99_006607 [Tulasnella sp. 403]
MGRRNITIEESSPLIVYSPPDAWVEGTDGEQLYSNNAFRSTRTYNATASFQFNGTGVWVHGGRKNTHGDYLASIDGVSTSLTGFVNATLDVDSGPLFSAPNLNAGIHTVTLTDVYTNASAPWLNIDYIVLEMEVPDETTRSVDDSEPSILYNPTGGWASNDCTDVLQYISYTCHSTASNVGTMQLAFQGDTVAVIGGVGPNYGPYSVAIDGTSRGRYTANWRHHHSLQLLYIASGLGSGNHTLMIQNTPQAAGDILDLDQIQIFGGNANVLSTPSQTATPAPTADSGKKKSLAGPIAGAVIGAIVLMIVVAGTLYQRRRKHRVRVLDLNQGNTPPTTQIQDIIPDPYVGVPVTGSGAYAPTSAIETGTGSHSKSQGTLTPLATSETPSGQRGFDSRDPLEGLIPPPYSS